MGQSGNQKGLVILELTVIDPNMVSKGLMRNETSESCRSQSVAMLTHDSTDALDFSCESVISQAKSSQEAYVYPNKHLLLPPALFAAGLTGSQHSERRCPRIQKLLHQIGAAASNQLVLSDKSALPKSIRWRLDNQELFPKSFQFANETEALQAFSIGCIHSCKYQGQGLLRIPTQIHCGVGLVMVGPTC
mmetsp:Transcript_27717/g.43268  ORF Transcript_27717/g.43268 Transcript_27717/m.43268 type:complete len:190 (+) Transcript_27717:270-839(+)